jgi:hypothetical protein
VRIIVQVPDLPPGSTKSHAVANYVRALITYQALRRDLAHAALDIARCKKALADRLQAQTLMAEAEAHALCEKLGIDVDISIASAVDNSR